jgi:hypothetical protein
MIDASPIPELDALEVAAAIHRAEILGHKDPADELMRAGFTGREAAQVVISCLPRSSNNALVNALIDTHIPALNKITEISPFLTRRLQKFSGRISRHEIRTRFMQAYVKIQWAPQLQGLGQMENIITALMKAI